MISALFKQNSFSRLCRYFFPQCVAYSVTTSILVFYLLYGEKNSLEAPILYFLFIGLIDFRPLIFKKENGVEMSFIVTICYLSRFAFLTNKTEYNIVLFWLNYLGNQEVLKRGKNKGGFYMKRTVSIRDYDLTKMVDQLQASAKLFVRTNNKFYGFSYKGIFGPIQSSVELCGDQIILMTYPQRLSFLTLFGINSSFSGDEGERLTNDLLEASKISHA